MSVAISMTELLVQLIPPGKAQSTLEGSQRKLLEITSDISLYQLGFINYIWLLKKKLA